MRFVIVALTFVLGGPAATSLAVHATGLASPFASLAAALPDPAASALLFCGLGLVAGARRRRSHAVAD